MFDLQDVEPKGIKKLCLVKQSWYVCQILQYCVVPDLHNISACQIFTIFGSESVLRMCVGGLSSPKLHSKIAPDMTIQMFSIELGEIVNYGFWIMTRTNLSSDN